MTLPGLYLAHVSGNILSLMVQVRTHMYSGSVLRLVVVFEQLKSSLQEGVLDSVRVLEIFCNAHFFMKFHLFEDLISINKR